MSERTPAGVPLAPETMERERSTPRLNPRVFFGAAGATLVVTIFMVLTPDRAESALGSVVGWTSDWFGWFYVALATIVLVFVIFLGVSRYGNTKLGPEHSRPEFSTFSWAAMLFAAGIGTDLMFFSVAEPVSQYLAPPVTEPETVAAAREATVWTLFHYGITGWGMYALMGMALAYFAYRMNLKLAVRSALRPLFGRRVDGTLGDAVDLAAILGTIFGVATTLGIGVVQLNVGLDMLFGVPQGLATQSALVVLAIVMASISAVSGVDKGIKRLSQLNVLLAIGLAAWVLVTGSTSYLLNALVENVGDFVRLFPGMTMRTFAFEDTGDWMSLWTLFFWAWWVAWASFVGLFLARISRGRTIRQFVAGTLIIPFSYILMWVSIFGNSAIGMIRSGNTEFGEMTMNQPELGFYTLLAEHPGFTFIASVATFVGLLFYVTSADSGALVMANLSSRLRTVYEDGPSGVRIFWAAATGALALALLAVGGIVALQYATIIMGLPFAFVIILVMIGLYRALRVEGHLVDARAGAMYGALSGRSTDQAVRNWQGRLRRVMTFTSQERADDFLADTVLPALTEVADELTSQGCAAQAESVTDEDGHPGVQLLADMDEELPFFYRISRREVPIPAYGRWAPRGDSTYSRLEVFLRRGGQGYDVMGYSKQQLIDDVLDAYERHIEFLRLHEGTTL